MFDFFKKAEQLQDDLVELDDNQLDGIAGGLKAILPVDPPPGHHKHHHKHPPVIIQPPPHKLPGGPVIQPIPITFPGSK